MGEWSGPGLRPSGTVFRQGVTRKAGANGWRDQKKGNGWLTETVKEDGTRKHPAFSKDVRRNKQRGDVRWFGFVAAAPDGGATRNSGVKD